MPLFEDVMSESEPPRVVSDDSQEYQQHGLMWKPVSVPKQLVVPPRESHSPPVPVTAPSANQQNGQNPICPPNVSDDIESAVAGLLGISHVDSAASQPQVEKINPPPPRESRPVFENRMFPTFEPPTPATRYEAPRVPSYAALTARSCSDPTTSKTIRLVPSKPKRSTTPVTMLSQLPMKPKKRKNGPRNAFRQPKSTAEVARQTDLLLKRGRGRPKKSSDVVGPPKQRQTVQRPSIVNLGKQSGSGRQIKRPKPFAQEVFGKNGRPPEFSDSDDESGEEQRTMWKHPSKPSSDHVREPAFVPKSTTAKLLPDEERRSSCHQQPQHPHDNHQNIIKPAAATKVVPEAALSKCDAPKESGSGRVIKRPKKFSDAAPGKNGVSSSTSAERTKETGGREAPAVASNAKNDTAPRKQTDVASITGSTDSDGDDSTVGGLIHPSADVPNSIAPPVQVVAETVTGRVVKKPTSFASEIFGKNGRKPVLDDSVPQRRGSDPAKRRNSDSLSQQQNADSKKRRNSDPNRQGESKADVAKRSRPVKHARPEPPTEKRGPGRPPKNGPGRPRKDEVPQKRGPGRPRKVPADGMQVKRGPGRPRKRPSDENDDRSKAKVAKPTTKPDVKVGNDSSVGRVSRRSFPPLPSDGVGRGNGGKRRETVEDMFKAIVHATVKSTVPSKSPPKPSTRRENPDVCSPSVARPRRLPKAENVAAGGKRRETEEDRFKAIVEATRQAELAAAQTEDSVVVETDDSAQSKRKRGRPKKSIRIPNQADGEPKRHETVEDMFKAIVQTTVDSTLPEERSSHCKPKTNGIAEKNDESKNERGRPRKSEAPKHSRQRTPSPVLGLRPKEQAALPWKRSSKRPKLFTSEVFGKNGHLPPSDGDESKAESAERKTCISAKRRGVGHSHDLSTGSKPVNVAVEGLRKELIPEQPVAPASCGDKGVSLTSKGIVDQPTELQNGEHRKSAETAVRNGDAAATSHEGRSGGLRDEAKFIGKPENVTVGSQIEIYWEGDEQYFGGIVKQTRNHQKGFYVVYDDGDKEWIDLGAHKFRLIGIDDATVKEARQSKSKKPDSLKTNDHKESKVPVKPAKEAQPRKSYNTNIKKARRGRKRNDSPADEVRSNEKLDDPEDNVYGLTVGCRVAVYWEGDRRYFDGKVTQKRYNERKNFFVEYDDGDHEWVDFDEHRFRVFLDGASDNDEEDTTAHSDDEDVNEQKALDNLREEHHRGNIRNVTVGSRVAVYWDGDNEYFKARVTETRKADKKSVHLKYDDGQKEWIDLRRQKFVQLPDKRPRGRPRIYPRLSREE